MSPIFKKPPFPLGGESHIIDGASKDEMHEREAVSRLPVMTDSRQIADNLMDGVNGKHAAVIQAAYRDVRQVKWTTKQFIRIVLGIAAVSIIFPALVLLVLIPVSVPIIVCGILTDTSHAGAHSAREVALLCTSGVVAATVIYLIARHYGIGWKVLAVGWLLLLGLGSGIVIIMKDSPFLGYTLVVASTAIIFYFARIIDKKNAESLRLHARNDVQILEQAWDKLMEGNPEAARTILQKSNTPAVQEFARRCENPTDDTAYEVRNDLEKYQRSIGAAPSEDMALASMLQQEIAKNTPPGFLGNRQSMFSPKREQSRSNRAAQLRLAVAAFENGNLIEAAEALEKSDYPIDRENAVNCRNLAFGGAAHMIQTLGYLLQEHLKTAETFKH